VGKAGVWFSDLSIYSKQINVHFEVRLIGYENQTFRKIVLLIFIVVSGSLGLDKFGQYSLLLNKTIGT
jgi:hypothetical protein